MRAWSPRRWKVAALATLGFGLLLGMPTDLIPNPIFGRQIEAPWWAYPALAITALLAGLLAATYVSEEPEADPDSSTASTSFSATEKKATAGGLLAVFAVGCPTCNALVVMALGANGALAFFEPVQPFLAIGGIALLGLALRRRLASEQACTLPTPPSQVTTSVSSSSRKSSSDDEPGF